MNSFGTIVRLTTFGESHGPAMGGILDGMPPGLCVDFDRIRTEIDRRRPGSRPDVSQRQETDLPEFLSGLSRNGITLGSPIGFIVRNQDARREDYEGFEGKFRPNHADFTYYKKYGVHDFSGGGRASARETVSWVIAGSLIRQWLDTFDIEISAEFVETNSVELCRSLGDSTGGIVQCSVTGLPIGVGEPVFDKLHSRLAAAMMSINAAKAFEYGDGFGSAYSRGSESLDTPIRKKNSDAHGYEITFSDNHSGGIQGGISNGMPVNFKTYFKPTPTLMRPVATLNSHGEEVMLDPRGRHDPCVAIRAVPIVEAMTAMVIADLLRIKY